MTHSKAPIRLIASICSLMLVATPFGAGAVDKTVYISETTRAYNALGAAIEGKPVDLDVLITNIDNARRISIEWCKARIKTHPEDEKLMTLLLAHAEDLPSLSKEQMQDHWYSGELLRANGIDMDKLDHFGSAFSLLDAVVHPSSAIIFIKHYQKTKDKDALSAARYDLKEVLAHVEHITD